MSRADGRQELPQLLDLQGVAERLGVGERHIRRLVAERRIPFIKWGHLLRFDPTDIAAWLDDRRTPPEAPAGLPSSSRGFSPALRSRARES